ncbi:MAG: DUF4982 domain-containing protein [Clostridium sp.]|nr:DUF4982 domain-containing protein [Clostridium sp.]
MDMIRWMKICWLTCLCACLGTMVVRGGDGRTECLLKKGWRFTRVDDADAVRTDYDDGRWQRVTVPHDWAIYGPFSVSNDKQDVAIAEDGQKEAMEHAGRTGGLPFVGVGWYRLRFDAPTFGPGRRAVLVFDGAMSHARVYVNGHEAGYWPYGYNSFHLDVTPYLKKEGNTLAVRLENKPESSRWYPGAGLYRNVHLVVTDEVAVDTWGTYITTPVVREDYARVEVRTELAYPDGACKDGDIEVETVLYGPAGGLPVAESGRKALRTEDEGVVCQQLTVCSPVLWDCENPRLYRALTRVYYQGTLTDEYNSTFGIRTLEVVPDKGFFLNGKRIVFQGTCNHHDLGPLGAAVNKSAIRRQLRILKDMGCNAYRTSHNMPAPELVEACNEMGMMLMAETFDEWKAGKMANGYHREFDEWVDRDVTNLVRHYRNAPAIVMWCTGNEVPDQSTAQGGKICRRIQDIFHREDPTRPCTQGMSQTEAVINNNFAAVMDVPGFNYRPYIYKEAYRKLPQQVMVGSETASTVSSRGVYKFPVERRSMAKYPDHQSSSYDVEHCSWSDLPEDNFLMYEELPYDMGEFVWTGFDYLGEPTPYYSDWPNHSSLFGIVDLAGLPKDRYYLYRSVWNREVETLHILPHWNWSGREGEVTPVFVYTNYPTVELFVNGKSQGRRTKDTSVGIDGTDTPEARRDFLRQKRYRLMWMDVRYEPGTVKAVAYDVEGKRMTETEIHTAGKPYRVELRVEENRPLVAGGDDRDLAFVTVRVVDRDGNLCPDADCEIRFRVDGAGEYVAGANGDPTCLESFQQPRMHVFHGQMTAIVGETGQAGSLRLKAESHGLKSAELKINVINNPLEKQQKE